MLRFKNPRDNTHYFWFIYRFVNVNIYTGVECRFNLWYEIRCWYMFYYIYICGRCMYMLHRWAQCWANKFNLILSYLILSYLILIFMVHCAIRIITSQVLSMWFFVIYAWKLCKFFPNGSLCYTHDNSANFVRTLWNIASTLLHFRKWQLSTKNILINFTSIDEP